jgi:Leucine-rich repeat (LRR) protein
MDNNNETFTLTTEKKERSIRKLKGGTKLDFWGLSYDDREKVRDNNVLDIINNDVKADAVTFISLDACTGITNATLMCIADKCTQLEKLYVRGCDMISDAGITAVANKNIKLRVLYYSRCTRVTDAALEVITNECPLLEELYAAGCGHLILPKDFGTKLPNLKRLDLRNNKLSKLPESLGQLADKCKRFDIFGNPLQNPPLAVAEQGFHAIGKYFKEINNYGAQVCNRQKIVVIGEGEAGKTSLVRLLQQFINSLTDEKDRTIHLDISDMTIQRAIDNFLIRVSCNDCGGKITMSFLRLPSSINSSAMY